ncbi:hypothetical protein D6829_00735 [Candidatus Pacearchaeota archaeon]|nr:MAG: hypothetical protein D6829_00735 [Candidatus Pacearchaeota archaeon]
MKNEKRILDTAALVFIGFALFALFFSFFNDVVADVGSPNVTVLTKLQVGNVYPEILNVSINDDASSVSLTPNNTKLVSCVAVIRDYNGEGDISNVNATFYDSAVAGPTTADDNNYHYTNTSCALNNSFGSYNGYSDNAYLTLANCSFYVWYYANPSNWYCNVTVNDSIGWTDTNWDNISISQLLALGLPDIIDYGTVNATEVSDEQTANVTNYGNVAVNLSLEGYAVTQGDGYAMNCTLGNVQNITIDYEKYNLTNSNPGTLTLTQFEANYTNLTSSAVVKFFNLTARQNDTQNEAIKPSYWRIYVPKGVAGNCTGHIVFGATTAAGS